MTNAIETDRLTKYYGSRCAVDSATFRVAPGTVYGLLGRNGAGKSTTIRMLLGMVQPSSGTARLLGHEVAALPTDVRGRISYLAEGHPLYRWMTVAEAVRFSRAFYPERWNAPMLDQVLDHFKLPRRQKIGRLSHGQRAHVGLALAIAPNPDLLILDDPTLGLDAVARRDFLMSIVQIIQRQGRTILFSSHILSDVERLADRIGILVDGVLRVDCPTDHFKESIRKVIVEFPGRPPTIPPLAGLVSARESGNRVELIIVNFGHEQQQILESLHPIACDVVAMNLEDAFVAYTRGSDAILPSFDMENVVARARDGDRDRGAA